MLRDRTFVSVVDGISLFFKKTVYLGERQKAELIKSDFQRIEAYKVMIFLVGILNQNNAKTKLKARGLENEHVKISL